MLQHTSPAAPVVVVKIGGSVLVGQAGYRRAAEFLRHRLREAPEERLLVVVSAENGVTDSLLQEAQEVVPHPDPVALDLLWSTGELRSVALLVMRLHALGVAAAGLNVHEAGLTLRDGKREAGGIEFNALRLRYALARSAVAVVPGFLARGPSDGIVSLGRGGSDLTAVLLAAGLRARRCELLKDVPGYFTDDPNRHKDAQHLPALGFERAIEMANEGCDLVQRQALEAAARCGVPLVIRNLNTETLLTRVGPARTEAEGSAGMSAAVALNASATKDPASLRDQR